jgi:hypothetical protein
VLTGAAPEAIVGITGIGGIGGTTGRAEGAVGIVGIGRSGGSTARGGVTIVGSSSISSGGRREDIFGVSSASEAPRVSRKRRISSTLWNRSAGFLARARSTARSSQSGMPGPGAARLGGGGISSIWAFRIA